MVFAALFALHYLSIYLRNYASTRPNERAGPPKGSGPDAAGSGELDAERSGRSRFPLGLAGRALRASDEVGREVQDGVPILRDLRARLAEGCRLHG